MQIFNMEMFLDDYFGPIIQSGATHRPVVQAKACDSHNVKRHIGGSAQARDIARVGWDLGFD
jgi:hypothetical protein